MPCGCTNVVRDRRRRRLVVEHDLEPAVEVALRLEPLRDLLGIELELAAEHLVVGAERDDRGAVAARVAELLELALRLAALEPHLVALAVALDR